MVTPAGLRWALHFADDYFLVSGGTQMWRPLLISLLLLRSLEVPLKWSKLRGGFQTDWYNFDLVEKTAGVSPSRARWAASWCTRMAEMRTIPMEDFREGLGRLAFAAALLAKNSGVQPAGNAVSGPSPSLPASMVGDRVLSEAASDSEE